MRVMGSCPAAHNGSRLAQVQPESSCTETEFVCFSHQSGPTTSVTAEMSPFHSLWKLTRGFYKRPNKFYAMLVLALSIFIKWETKTNTDVHSRGPWGTTGTNLTVSSFAFSVDKLESRIIKGWAVLMKKKKHLMQRWCQKIIFLCCLTNQTEFRKMGLGDHIT